MTTTNTGNVGDNVGGSNTAVAVIVDGSEEENNNSNIIRFPQSRIVRYITDPRDEDELRRKMERIKSEIIQTVLESLLETIVDRLGVSGIELDTPEENTDVSFFMEAIRAAIYRQENMVHPLHSYIDERYVNITYEDDGEITIELVPEEEDGEEE